MTRSLIVPAVAGVAAAAYLAVSPPVADRWGRLFGTGTDGGPAVRRPLVTGRAGRWLVPLLAAATGVALAGPWAGVPAGTLGVFGHRAWRRRAATAAAARTRSAVPVLCTDLAALLRAGHPAPAALASAAASSPLRGLLAPLAGLPCPVEAAADELRSAAAAPGADGLRAVAACWLVVGAGAPAAPVLDVLAETMAAEEQARREVDAGLAGARASMHVLGLLPLAGLALAAGLGARPLALLGHTPLGFVLDASAGVLMFAGWAWARRIAAGAAG